MRVTLCIVAYSALRADAYSGLLYRALSCGSSCSRAVNTTPLGLTGGDQVADPAGCIIIQCSTGL